MPERCTCGAVLPDDALFCHRCGKPQREIAGYEEPVPEPAIVPPPIPPPPAPAIGFSNGPAVRTALLAGVLSIVVLTLTQQVSPLQLLFPLWPAAGGFLAVYLYSRKTGQKLTTLSGAHLGWISGLFGFLIVAVFVTAFTVAITDPSVVSQMRMQWSHMGLSEAQADTLIDAFHHPQAIAAVLASFLLLFSVLPAFGGAIGAKLLDRPDIAGRN